MFKRQVFALLLLPLLLPVAVAEDSLPDSAPFLDDPQVLENYVPAVFAELTLEQLSAQIRVTASRDNAAFDFNMPGVVTYLPALPNSHYARFEFSATELADGVGTAVPFAQSTGYSETEFTMNLRFGKEDYSGNADFAQARGVIDLKYPLTVQTLSIAREDRIAQETYGLFMDGPFVLDLDFDNGRADPSFSVDVYGPLRAFDAQGRALKSGRDLHAQITEHGYASVHAFHGPIARLELDIVTRMAHVEIRYDLPAAPELPESEAGLRRTESFPDLPGAKVDIVVREVVSREMDEQVPPEEATSPASEAAQAPSITAPPQRTPPNTTGMSREDALQALAGQGFDDASNDGLFQAVAMNNLEAVGYFLAAGVSPDVRNEEGMTPATLASMMVHAEIMLLLLEAGSDPNQRDIRGMTPLLSFAGECDTSHLIQRLLAAGADPNAELSPGMRPLGIAQTMQCTDNQRLLKAAGAR